jgi:hypothetical protein
MWSIFGRPLFWGLRLIMWVAFPPLGYALTRLHRRRRGCRCAGRCRCRAEARTWLVVG